MGVSHVSRLCLQGGGVYVQFGAVLTVGMVTLSLCTITENSAEGVRAHAQNSPMGKMADALASTLACITTAGAPVNYSGYVPHRL